MRSEECDVSQAQNQPQTGRSCRSWASKTCRRGEKRAVDYDEWKTSQIPPATPFAAIVKTTDQQLLARRIASGMRLAIG